MTATVTIATWNVLTDLYVRSHRYPLIDPEHLDHTKRYPRILDRLVALDADILCLQEVDVNLFANIEKKLARAGYKCRLHPKEREGVHEFRSEGCAVCVREPWIASCPGTLVYDDATPHMKRSGHSAFLASIEVRDHRFLLVNTHLKWDPPMPGPSRRLRATRHLLRLLEKRKTRPAIICGDLNAEPDSEVLSAFHHAGFANVHPPETFTYNFTGDGLPGRPIKIDHLLHTGEFSAEPLPAAAVTAETLIPSADMPSDHIPLIARFTFDR